ncbi:uncharacterized protein ACB058_003452 isoform 1-T2 [Synchiropus picturatus]
MEQPPGDLNDLQPQDVSNASIPAALDLTRKVDLNKTKDALRVVRSPGWHQSTGTNNTSISCSKTSTTDVALQPATQVKPDNAFSRTTVTLSYVSRSHIYPSVDAQSEDPSLCTAPPDSTLSLQSPSEAKKDVCENGFHSEHTAGLAMSPDEIQQTFQWLNGDGHHSVTTDGKHTSTPEMGRIAGEDALAKSSNTAPGCFTEKDKRTREVNVPLLSSMNHDCGAVPDNVATRDLCSLRKKSTSPLEDPLSPSDTPLDNRDGIFVLPDASSSPNTVSSLSETANAVKGTEELKSSMKDETQDSRILKRSRRQKLPSNNFLDFTDEICLFGTEEEEHEPKVNGNAKTQQRNWQVKKLPVRSSRGMRLETMNLDSLTVVSQQVHCNKAVTQKKRAGLKRKTQTPIEKTTGILLTDTQTDTNSTSDSAVASQTDQAIADLSPKMSQVAVHKTLRKESECLSANAPSETVSTLKTSPATPRASPKKQSKSPRSKATAQRSSSTPKTKAAKTPRRRRKRLKQSPSSSMFAPKEPDIKLKYVNYKEEKRDYRLSNFSPFIHVERRPSSTSLCTVVNEPEEMKPQQLQKSQRQQSSQASTFVSATVPSTSCLQLGRVSTQGQSLRSFVCCLCQLSANTMDLGDLLGPYYSEGYQPGTSTPACTPGLQEDKDDWSDSDSSFSCLSTKRRKCALPRTSRPSRPTMLQKPTGPSQFCHLTEDDCDSPVAKRPRTDPGAADARDWYSPPMLPMQSCEYWLHVDCGIWAAGVFLVRGKVYGLKEAVKVAQETMCSACCSRGATLGCFFKGCPNKYHYRCALQSDCILIEENFSMKCKKHKNKTLNGSVGKCQNKR